MGIIHPFFAKHHSKSLYVLLIFSIGCLIRTIPILLSYPYSGGYDVTNYYMPAVTLFEERWSTFLDEYPIYVFLLYFLNISAGLDPFQTVMVLAVLTFGVFAVVLFYIGKKILALSSLESVFLCFFVIVQFAVLRTTLDLHRDLFALTTMLITMILVYNKNSKVVGWRTFTFSSILSAITVMSDGMVGALLLLTLIGYSFISRAKVVIVCTIVTTSVFALTILPIDNNLHNVLYLNLTQETETGNPDSAYYLETNRAYTSKNLIVFFFVVNALLIPTGIIGLAKALKQTRSSLLLAFPVLLSLSLSILGIVFTENTTLVSHRWSIVLGIFLSIFAAYGIISLVKRQKLTNQIKRVTILSLALILFIVIGMGFAVMPRDQPFILFDAARPYMASMSPATMQPNKLSYDRLLSEIFWINNNTENNSMIIGVKDMRGPMQLYLEPERKWEDFGFSRDTSKRFFMVLESIVTDNGNHYLVTRSDNFLDYASNKFEYTNVHSGHLNIFKLKRTT